MIVIAVGLGMMLNLLLTETIGLAAGGVVVPGYIALNLHHPDMVISTVITALLTYLIIYLLSHYILLYGRRLLIISIIIGYLLGYFTRIYPSLSFETLKLDITTIGFVVPGLIAYWIQRQGIIETISTMFIAAVIVRLVLIILSGGVILQ
jgi:poly-gamma-glutamate biosynthesis protein PgsC/CapC|uniref:Poly-gamma-glutamate biosynthesis protein PgsC n=1 Tax=candidate division WOR-3 bacterium TaxID=2052148 RepID=A0A7C4TAZ3_UNCW3